MYRCVHSVKSISNTNIRVNIKNITQFRVYNHINGCNKFFSTSNDTQNLLDDSQEIDPELVESLPPNTPFQPHPQHFQQLQHEQEQLNLQQMQQLHEYYQQQKQPQSSQQESSESPIPAIQPIASHSQLTKKEIKSRQHQTWTEISSSLQSIWESMKSIDITNVKRIDRVYKKLQKLEELHVKNIQHSLHHIAMLRDEVSTVNSRINYVFQRLEDLEKTSPSEWLEWSVPKYEIPFEDGLYLRSPGYEVGSMVWCIELRWEIDESLAKEHEVDVGDDDNENESNPIIDMRQDIDNKDNKQDESDGNSTSNNNEYNRINKGFQRLGVYVSPRSVANWERLSSLKATCELRINENDYSEAMSIIRDNEQGNDLGINNKTNKKQQHFSVSGEFLRGKKLTSWGRTIANGEDFFDKKKIDDEISIKLRIVNQTLCYQQYADDNKDDVVTASISESDIETISSNPQFTNFDFSEKQSTMLKQEKKKKIDEEMEEKVQNYMSIPLNEFWNIFSDQVESGRSKQGYSFAKIAKMCDLDPNLISMFRIGPNKETFQVEADSKEEEQKWSKLTAKQRDRKRNQMKKTTMAQSKKWEVLCQHDAKNPEFRRKLATFLIKHIQKKQRHMESKTAF